MWNLGISVVRSGKSARGFTIHVIWEGVKRSDLQVHYIIIKDGVSQIGVETRRVTYYSTGAIAAILVPSCYCRGKCQNAEYERCGRRSC